MLSKIKTKLVRIKYLYFFHFRHLDWGYILVLIFCWKKTGFFTPFLSKRLFWVKVYHCTTIVIQETIPAAHIFESKYLYQPWKFNQKVTFVQHFPHPGLVLVPNMVKKYQDLYSIIKCRWLSSNLVHFSHWCEAYKSTFSRPFFASVR